MRAKIMHIVGNRPQLIKLAPLTWELHSRGYQDIIIHTGQHYDSNMSDIFFEELRIEKPVENLGVGSGSHAETTARVIVGVEKAVQKHQPSLVILYGDTDSTLAAALACRKLNVPIIHVEAGIRSYSKINPEEVNRVIVDHISEVCFCSDKQSVSNLKKEGIEENVYFSGDIMYDAFLQTKENLKSDILETLGLQKKEYVLMTWHRQENTDSRKRMTQILSFLEKVNKKILYPIHPRTKKMLEEFDLWERADNIKNLIMIDPVGYREMVFLQSNCKMILTDSGGLSKESFFAGVRCLFMLDLKIWPDLERIGWLKHIEFEKKKSVQEALDMLDSGQDEIAFEKMDFYGDGTTAQKIVDVLEDKIPMMKGNI